MRYANLIPLIASALLVASCASSRAEAPVEGCSVFGEPLLGRVVGHATYDETAADPLDAWREYGLDETGRLTQSERDKKDGLAVIKLCEARDQRAYRRINAAWYEFWVR
jgi:hypothetical protein